MGSITRTGLPRGGQADTQLLASEFQDTGGWSEPERFCRLRQWWVKFFHDDDDSQLTRQPTKSSSSCLLFHKFRKHQMLDYTPTNVMVSIHQAIISIIFSGLFWPSWKQVNDAFCAIAMMFFPSLAIFLPLFAGFRFGAKINNSLLIFCVEDIEYTM